MRTYTHTEDNKMKNIMNKIGNFFLAIGEARYATWLARNGRIEEVKAFMTRK